MVLFAAGCGEDPAGERAPQPFGPGSLHQGGPTPLQGRIAHLMADRDARGVRTPKVSFEFNSPQGSSLSELQKKRYGPGEGYAYTARTVIHYEGPADAGLEEWPALTLSAKQSAKFGVDGAELRRRYVSKREASSPGFWDRYALGFEPRTYTVTESGTAVYRTRLSSAPADASASATPAAVAAAATNQDELAFGFSVGIPAITASRTIGIEDVEELTLSFEADWDVGLRLPVLGRLDSPAPMAEGSTYSATSTVQGRNWSGSQYSGVGLPAEGGHEVYFRWIEQGCVEFSGIIDSGKQCAGPDVYRFQDFVTPFGPGDDVPLPPIDVAIIDYGVAGIDLRVNSSVGSDKITADWSVVGAALGSGHLSYNSPASPQALSSVRAIDGPGHALFSVDGFLYHFTRFEISPSLRLWVDLEIPIPLAPDIDWQDSFSIPLGTYDLSDFIDHDFLDSHGASVGVHHNPSYTGATRLTMDVDVVNVAPTAHITLAGGQKVDINGVSTILGNFGTNFTLTGVSHDPGRDGLTLSWDWGDGLPTPDESAVYPVQGPTGPNDATDVRIHAFNRACLYDVRLKSVDDDAAFGEDHVSILVTETGRAARMEGFWQHQLGRSGGDLLNPAIVNCYLAIVGRVSAIFSEVRAASSMDAAFAVVNVRQNTGSELEQLDREILVAWLNFASGAMGYSQLLDTNGDKTNDTPLYQVMRTAEAVRLDPSSTPTALRGQTQIVHKVSEQFTGSVRD